MPGPGPQNFQRIFHDPFLFTGYLLTRTLCWRSGWDHLCFQWRLCRLDLGHEKSLFIWDLASDPTTKIRLKHHVLPIYCWWKKSCTSWHWEYHIFHRVSCATGGAGFLPSTVSFYQNETQCNFSVLGRSTSTTNDLFCLTFAYGF